MGYIVKRGLQIYGRYETKEAAYEAIKTELFNGQLPKPTLTSLQGDEHYDSPNGIVSVILDQGNRGR